MPWIRDCGSTVTNAEERHAVGERGDDAAREDRPGHVALRILHLLGCAVLELEADAGEDQERHERDERLRRRLEVARAVAVQTVLDRIDHDRDGEEDQHHEAHEHSDPPTQNGFVTQ